MYGTSSGLRAAMSSYVDDTSRPFIFMRVSMWVKASKPYAVDKFCPEFSIWNYNWLHVCKGFCELVLEG